MGFLWITCQYCGAKILGMEGRHLFWWACDTCITEKKLVLGGSRDGGDEDDAADADEADLVVGGDEDKGGV